MMQNLLKLYKDCYEADTRTVNLTNFFSAKVENKLLLKGKDELINGNLPTLPISQEYSREVIKKLAEYEKEKSLYLFTCFACGKVGNENRRHRLAAPLFFYPAEIIKDEDDEHYLKINRSLAFPNTTFLEPYRKDSSLEITELFADILAAPQDFGSFGNLRGMFEDNFNNFDAEQLLLYPTLSKKSEVEHKWKSENETITIYPAMGLGVITHSSRTLGVISELKEMADLAEYSRAVDNFSRPDLQEVRGAEQESTYVPAILSVPQQNILDSINHFDETLVIGPPGTGKSYTIAAAAIDQLTRGKSVLIVSKTNQAVDVIIDKIEKELEIDGVAIRAGSREYLRLLKHKLKIILSGLPAIYALSEDEADKLKIQIAADAARLKDLETKLYDQIEDDLTWGKFLFEEKSGVFATLKKRYIKWRNSLQHPHWEIALEYYQRKEKHIENLKRYIELKYEYRLWSTLKNYRKMLRTFLQALRARTLGKQEELMSEVNFNIIFRAIPIWACKLSDLYEVFPMDSDMFDVVIIDEATQCDIASCLPALQRAKKVVIVGDPMQLRHYSFISRRFNRILAEKYDVTNFPDNYLNYRDNSILDIYFHKITSQDQVVFLDEHFRGNESLIRFSNQHFYDNKLRVIKALPHHNADTANVVYVNGYRDKNGVNEIEAMKIIDHLLEVVQNEEDLRPEVANTIGIISPFRNQAEHLKVLIERKISLHNIQRHKIKVGTPYEFQGDERDIVLISWCIDKESHATAYNYLNTRPTFNVTVTRSKFELTSFMSLQASDLAGDSLLGMYISTIGNPAINDEIHQEGDKFIASVADVLEGKVKSIHLGYELAGILIDVLLETTDGSYYGLNLIGYPGKFFHANSIIEYEILDRSGVRMLPLPFSNWYYDRDSCIEGILDIISSKG